MEVHGLRVLKYDGTVADFPVANGDVGQAQLRASLSQRPGDLLVAVTEHAYIRLTKPGAARELARPRLHEVTASSAGADEQSRTPREGTDPCRG